MSEAPARPSDPNLTITPEARPAPRPRSASGASRRAPAPRAPGPRAPAPSRSVLRLQEGVAQVLRRPAWVVGGIVGLAAISAVAVNALNSQKGRHPAPLFAKHDPAKQDSGKSGSGRPEASPAEARQARPARPTDKPAETPRDAIAEVIRGETPTTAQTTASLAPREPARAAAQKALAVVPPSRPKSLPAAPPATASAKAAAPASDPQIAFAQRALVKLGYGPLAIDGLLGPTTRAALARFERERSLPGPAQVPVRTLNELASRSGLKPER
ncbi:peptidoglycan-binding domain-containing protein [Methylobacterium oryzisoli]|uniref:peptidoglycan-binding domain-containing protein n=1 Tax=Methylobacterium oryzisoli TaxID=3385502 RepID=UPI003892142E